MSVKVSSWVWHDERAKDLKGNDMLAMLALADIADDDGNVLFASEAKRMQPELASKARMSVATFRRATEHLREFGLLEISRETQRSANAYRILLAPLSVSAQDERSNGVIAQVERSRVSDHTSLIDVSLLTAKKGSRIDDDWRPSEQLMTWAKAEAQSVDLEMETSNFVDYWAAIPGQRGIKLSWDRTWRTWVRRAHARNVERGWKPAPVVALDEEWLYR